MNYAMNIIPFHLFCSDCLASVSNVFVLFSTWTCLLLPENKLTTRGRMPINKSNYAIPRCIVEDVEIKRAPDFRKWLKDANENKVVAVKVDDYYFIPVTSKYQQTHVDSITGPAAAQGSVLVGQSKKENLEAVTTNEAIINVPLAS